MSDEPTSTKCALCNRTLKPDETMTCLRCVERLDETLENIVELYALLPSVLLPGSVLDDMPHGRRVDPPAPVRLDVLALGDPRSKSIPGDDEDNRTAIPYVLGVLESWARLIREERQLTVGDEPTVAGEADFLRRHLSWIGEQPFVDEFEREIRDLRRSLRDVTGEHGPKPIGACPAERIENGEVVTCGAALYAPLSGDVVRCGRCKAQWTRDRWRFLGEVLGVIGEQAG